MDPVKSQNILCTLKGHLQVVARTGPTFSSSSSIVNPATLTAYSVSVTRSSITAFVALPPNTLTEPKNGERQTVLFWVHIFKQTIWEMMVVFTFANFLVEA